jgi:uncharacterized protein YciI
MKYLMIYETAPDGAALARQHFPAHRARLAEFHARGTLLLAGPLLNPPDQAIGIFTTREAAEEFIRGDPFVQNGVVAKSTIREWQEVLG